MSRPPFTTPADDDRQGARLRAAFRPPAETIYLDGNSLGAYSPAAAAAVNRVLDEWRERAIGGWLDADPPWYGLAEDIAARLARWVGAHPDEVAVTGQTTLNLHQVLATLHGPDRPRPAVAVDALAFPSDRIAVEGHLRSRGGDPARDLRVVPSRDGRTLRLDDLEAALAPDVGVLLVPSVLYTSGQRLDLGRLAAAARAAGTLLVVDAAHSVGIDIHRFHDDGVDAAVWCTYKHLAGGPGAPGALFLHRRHHGRPAGLPGWWGLDPTVRFARESRPAAGAAALAVGTPPLLALAAVDAALRLLDEAGPDELRRRSLELTDVLLAELDHHPATRAELIVATPRPHADRGAHVSLAHPHAAALVRALAARRVIADFRAPDLVRLCPSPLVVDRDGVREAVRRLAAILEERRWDSFSATPGLVP